MTRALWEPEVFIARNHDPACRATFQNDGLLARSETERWNSIAAAIAAVLQEG